MSLLRDALRKAERAQEEARQQAGVQPLALEPLPAFEPVAPTEDSPLDFAAAPDSEPRAEATDARIEAAVAKKTAASPMREPNPRLPFYLAVSVLALAAAGVAGYFWLELRPRSALAPSTPSRPAGLAHAATAKPAATEPRLATIEEALAALPGPAARIEAEPIGETAAKPAEVPRPSPPERQTDPITLPRPSAGTLRVAEVESAHQLKEIRFDSAASAALHASLGSEFARSGRWRDAQVEFANALARDPQNPDLAFNLAVSHDRLREKREAAAHYEHALRLRRNRPAHFPADAARERMRYLAR